MKIIADFAKQRAGFAYKFPEKLYLAVVGDMNQIDRCAMAFSLSSLALEPVRCDHAFHPAVWHGIVGPLLQIEAAEHNHYNAGVNKHACCPAST